MKEHDKTNDPNESNFFEPEDTQWEDFDDDLPETGTVSPFLKIIALITVISFLGVVLLAAWPGFKAPLAELVKESLRLEKEIDTKKLQAAVVEISVVSGSNPLKASAKKGTGFNISREGLIVTNNHVISGARNMTIKFKDGTICQAESWLPNQQLDLALIKLKGKDLPVVPLNTEKPAEPGEAVRIVGNPLGLNNIIVDGKINGYFNAEGQSLLSIDAPVYPGNSGSPVFDQEGLVIGVVFAKYNTEVKGETRTFGIAVPISNVLDMI